MKLGENILNLRKANHLSQEELAEKVGVTRQTISNWELGVTEPTPKQLKILSEIFQISIDKLLDHDTSDILVEKVSNTEKLAGIIIKILKVIGILFLVLLVIDILSLILFTVIEKNNFTVMEASINCTLAGDNYYTITVSSNEEFSCLNCSEEIKTDLKNLLDYSNVNKTLENIDEYFINHNGFCS